MKPRSGFGKIIQKALQLDFFSDLLFSDCVVPDIKKTPLVLPDVSPTAPRPLGNTGNKRQILLQDTLLEYELQRSKRRSIGFLITTDGLRITAPRWVTIGNIEQAIGEKQRWIVNKLRERNELDARRRQATMRWEDGASLPYFGDALTLRIAVAARISIEHNAGLRELTVCLPEGASEQLLKDRVQLWLKQEARRIFSERLPLYAEKLGVSYHSMMLSSASTRWGSCTSQGKIRLNWRLVHFSLDLIDYVIAHELSHICEMNHSPQFWATVASIFPDYEQARKTLRQHASAELPKF
jgi:predicted metal-dependent hydrolase